MWRPLLSGFIATLLLASSAMAANPAGVDPSFGIAGRSEATVGRADYSLPSTTVRHVAVASDGKLLVDESIADAASNAATAVTRFDAHGRLDMGFGTDGSVELPFAITGGFVVTPDGGVVVVGSVVDSTSTGLAAAKLDASGRVLWSVVHSALYDGLVIARQPDGKLVIGGSAVGVGWPQAAVARLNDADGSLDTTFAGQGYVVAPPRPPGPAGCSDQGSAITAVQVMASGEIVIGGSGHYACGVGGSAPSPIFHAYSPTGQLDATFGQGTLGLTEIDGLVSSPNGSITAFGDLSPFTAGQLAFAHYAPAGALDPSFGAPLGYSRAPGFGPRGPQGFVHDFAVQSDERLLGTADVQPVGGGQTNLLLRTLSDGRPDASFGHKGIVTLPAPTLAIALQPDGKIVLAGQPTADRYASNTILLTRLHGGLARGHIAIGASARVHGPTARLVLTCGPLGATPCTGSIRGPFKPARFTIQSGRKTTLSLRVDEATLRKLHQAKPRGLRTKVRASNAHAKATTRRITLHG